MTVEGMETLSALLKPPECKKIEDDESYESVQTSIRDAKDG